MSLIEGMKSRLLNTRSKEELAEVFERECSLCCHLRANARCRGCQVASIAEGLAIGFEVAEQVQARRNRDIVRA